MDKKLAARYLTREVLGLIIMGAALFWSAGRVDWWPAWATLAITSGWVFATAFVIFRFNPGLLAERLGPRKGAKPWDVKIMSLLGLIQLARYIVAGLDQHYGWSSGIPFAVQIGALILCVLGYAMFVWAMACNAFFSQIVRIQPERGQTVVTKGPYHFVRHPAYSGAILTEVTVPMLLASWWAFLLGIFNVFLLILRTALEDRALQAELAGYVEYMRQVRHRLLPGLW